MGRRKGPRQGAGSTPDNTPIPQDDDFLAAFLQLDKEPPPAGEQTEPIGLPIARVVPDPVQPRRSMPEDLRARWVAGDAVGGLLDEWQSRVLKVINKVGEPVWRVMPSTFIQTRDDPTPLEEKGEGVSLPPDVNSWIDLARLAGSIHQVGLEQPVTVYPPDPAQDWYMLIVGERRLLAFHLLHWMKAGDYSHIPAIRRASYNAWSQAFENGARQSLNAVSKARQLALLLMTLNPNLWSPVSDGTQPDQDWYAQAAALRVPYGKAEAVATVMGLPNPRMVRFYRALLTLPCEVWTLADRYDWAEGKLRSMMAKAQNSDQLIRMARLEAGLEREQKPQPTPDVRVRRLVSQAVAGKRPDVNKLSADDRHLALQAIGKARDELDDLEQALRTAR